MTTPVIYSTLPWQKPKPFAALTEAEKKFRMLGNPPIRATGPQVITGVYKPRREDWLRWQERGIPTPIKKIVEVTDSNGTVKIAVDENGTVVDAEKKGLTPLQMGMLAVGAFLLFGG